MNIESVITQKLSSAFAIKHIELINESHMHSGPATDSHFKLTLVTDDFNGKTLVKRHQEIYKILAEELKSVVHALAIHSYTEQEWQQNTTQVPDSPNCKGGSAG